MLYIKLQNSQYENVIFKIKIINEDSNISKFRENYCRVMHYTLLIICLFFKIEIINEDSNISKFRENYRRVMHYIYFRDIYHNYIHSEIKLTLVYDINQSI